jgi:hypothetical protein
MPRSSHLVAARTPGVPSCPDVPNVLHMLHVRHVLYVPMCTCTSRAVSAAPDRVRRNTKTL